MGTALLLGTPPGYVRTIESAIERSHTLFSDWSVQFINAPRSIPEITAATLKRACVLADKSDAPHIFGFSSQQNRKHFADQIRPYFRFRWFDHTLLKHIGSPDPGPFVERLASDLQEEAEWAARVRPSDNGSPLLLPECSFDAGKKHGELWRHATSYGDINNIVAAEKAVHSFRTVFRRKVELKNYSHYKWVDERDRIYDEDGPKHGQPSFPRGWKYSYRLIVGFHFDVSHRESREFSVYDADGIRHSIVQGAHINIDPHGFVRG